VSVGRQIQVVIPMAGKGERFIAAGYSTPKPLLPIHGIPMYRLVLSNLLTESVVKLVIVSQASWQLQDNVRQLSTVSGIPTELIEIDYFTQGPAETVALARSHLDPKVPVITGNSDQYVDADLSSFFHATMDDRVSGSILTMLDDDPKWSYAAVTEDGWVTRVKEKEVISPHATVGIYGFTSAEVMFQAFELMKQADDHVRGEFYVAPAYNYLINRGEEISIVDLGPISTVMYGMGTPEDYEHFLSTDVSQRAVSRAVALGLD